MAEHRVLQMAEVYKHSVIDARKWVRLLTGRSDIIKPTRVVLRRVWARIRNALRWATRLIGLPMSDDLVVELRKLRARRARLEHERSS